MARLSIALLGPFAVTLDDQPVSTFAYAKVRALLAYLALHAAQPQARSALAELLWPDAPPDAARKNLRTALGTLRQAIDDPSATPPFLVISRDSLQWNALSSYDLDVAAFRAGIAAAASHTHADGALCAGCAAHLSAALARYRGPFLQDVALPDSLPFDEWSLLTREELHRQALAALGQLVAYHEAYGEDEAVRRYAWRQLALEPWDEGAHRALMRLFARSGQRAAALAQYERCRQILAEELSLAPAAETTALYERLRERPTEQRADVVLAGVGTEALTFAVPQPTPANPAAPLQALAASPAAEQSEAAFAQDSAGDRNRPRMLRNVKAFWIDGILAQSLHGAALITLGLVPQPDAVEHPWQLAMQRRGQTAQPIPPATELIDVYDMLDGELLILGTPGAGKTTLMLELARSLIARAEQNPALPMPVVFNLSSWAAQPRPLAVWLADELNIRYQVPRRLARTWIEAAQILPLLDGLDEVVLAQRAACVDAINAFRSAHWLLDMVVCSRSADYAMLTAKLRLEGAVLVQPPTPQQVADYLAQGGAHLATLRLLLAQDAALRALADTPLMLSIMLLAYRDLPHDALAAQGSPQDWHRQLFDAYLQRMLAHRNSLRSYVHAQTLHWLSWMAQAMAQRAQSLFFIESLQPDWLTTRGQQRAYAGGVLLVFGLAAGVVAALNVGLRLSFAAGIAALPSGLLLGLAAGLVAGLLSGLLTGLTPLYRALIAPQRSWQRLVQPLLLGMTLGLTFGIVDGLAFSLPNGIASGLMLSTIWLPLTLLRTQTEPIAPVEHLRWSLTMLKQRGLLLLLICGVGTLLFAGLLNLWQGVAFGLSLAVPLLLVLGLNGQEIAATTVPNQGIWRSARSALGIGVLTGALLGGMDAACAMLFGIGEAWFAQEHASRLWLGLANGVGPALVGLFGGAVLYGGLTCIQHLVLRFLLWRGGAAPWNYAGFLDDAAARLVLHKVGGGYVFVHRLLLEHIAGLGQNTEPLSVERRTQAPAMQNGVAAHDLPGPPQHGAVPAHLPTPPTPLLGRDHDLAHIRARLADAQTRLLTLVGPPGIGKTRLALAAAAASGDAFADGVFLAELAAVRDPALLPDAIAQALALQARGQQPVLAQLHNFLRAKAMLLVLDNCEQLRAAAPLLAELLAQSPGLRILATSRVPLHIRAERLIPVAPLALPDPAQLTDEAAIAASPAVALFVERSQARAPKFALTTANAATVAAICMRLDGLPLAIELAASQSGMLTPATLLADLDRRLTLLVDGPQDLPERQRTLHRAISWSYELLSSEERDLFARLAVFDGGWTLEAAEAVCGQSAAPRSQVTENLTALLQKSLLSTTGADRASTRFGMLETIRAYALEQLERGGTAASLRTAHAAFYCRLAEAVRPALCNSDVLLSLTSLEAEHPNLRAALRWCRDTQQVMLGTQLAGALGLFWQLHSHFAEGRAWLELFLCQAEVAKTPPHLWARALLSTGWLAYYQDDYAPAATCGAQALAHYAAVRDTEGQTQALNLLGFCSAALGDYAGGIVQLERSVALGRTSGEPYALASALLNLGFLHNDQGDLAQAQPLFDESLRWARQAQHPILIAQALNALGELSRMHGAYAAADAHYCESLAHYETMAHRRGLAIVHHNLGWVRLYLGDLAQAQRHFANSLSHYRDLGDTAGTAAALAGLAGVIGSQGQWQQAASVFSAAHTLRARSGAQIVPPDRYDYDRHLAAVRAKLDDATFAACWDAGRLLSVEHALEAVFPASAARPPSALRLADERP